MLLPRAPALHSLLPAPAALRCHPSCRAPPLPWQGPSPAGGEGTWEEPWGSQPNQGRRELHPDPSLPPSPPALMPVSATWAPHDTDSGPHPLWGDRQGAPTLRLAWLGLLVSRGRVLLVGAPGRQGYGHGPELAAAHSGLC